MAGKKAKQLTLEEKLQNALVPKEEQPYKIPNNWCWTRLNILTDLFTGNSINAKLKESKYMNLSKGYNYIATKDINYNSTINYNNGVKIPFENSFKIAKKGSSLLCIEGGSAGRKIGLLNQDVCFVNKLCALYPKKIEDKYLFYFLQSPIFIVKFKEQMNGLIGGVSTSKLKDIPIALTSLAEQQRIVKRIESLFAKIDRAKDLIENTLAQVEQNKMAILHKAFTGELTAKWRKENNIDLSSWKEYELKEVFKVVKDKYNPQTENQIVNYIGLENIETSKGIISKNNSSEVKSIKTKFKKDDVLYGKLRPYLNKHDVVNFDGICSTDILVFRFNDINTAKYINYYFNLPMFIQYAVENSSGINLPRVSEKTISKYKISLPTIKEQQEIVNILDKLLAKYNKIQNLNKQLEQIELLKKSILAKAFRGELGTNDPQEESAEKLLAEILAEN